MEQFLLLLACHFIGDFPLQSQWMSEEKSKRWEINFYHVVVYTSVFVIAGTKLSLVSLVIIFVTHFLIDTLSARWKIVKHIWQDQLLHVLVLIFVFLVTK